MLELEAIVALEHLEDRDDVAGGRNRWPDARWFQGWPRYGSNLVEQVQRVAGRVSNVTWIELPQGCALHLVVEVHGVRVLLVDQVVRDEWEVR